MFVYFIQQGVNGPIKIGKADRPDRRLAALQGANPETLRIRALCAGGHSAERHIRRYFAPERLKNKEWFLPSARLEAFLNKLPSWEEIQAGARCPYVVGSRELIVCRLYREGYSFRDIGELFGFSHQRAKQIFDDHEGPRRSKKRNRKRPCESIVSAYERLSAEYSDTDLLFNSDEK